MTKSPESIAMGLTEAQKRAVTWDWSKNHPAHGQKISTWGDRGVADQLYGAGLTLSPETFTELSPLGLQVRSILKEQGK